MSDPARTLPPVDADGEPGAHSPFPVDPEDVPPEAVRFVRRRLLRPDPDPQVIVAGVIAVLSGPEGPCIVCGD